MLPFVGRGWNSRVPIVDPVDRFLQTGHLSQAPLQLPCCPVSHDNGQHISLHQCWSMLPYMAPMNTRYPGLATSHACLGQSWYHTGLDAKLHEWWCQSSTVFPK